MSEFKETNETAGEVGEANEIKLPQEVSAPQQEIQEPQETSVAKGDIAAALKKKMPTNKEVSVSQQEVQASQETTLTTDDIASALKKDDISPRRTLKTDYSTALWGKAADEVNQENKDVNQFVQELEQKGLTPEQYLAQKLSEYAALDDPIRKEGHEPQATSVPKDSIAAALKKEVPAKTEVPALQQEVQAPQETSVTKGDIAVALKKETLVKKEVTPSQQEIQASQETTATKGEVAAALKKETPAKKEVVPPKQDTQETHKVDQLEVKFETKEEISAYIKDALEKLKDSDKKNYQIFNEYLKENNTTIEDLVQQPFGKGRNYSRYVTNIANLAMKAEIDSKYAGTIAHRIAELHTLNAHPERILDGSRLVEQKIGGGLEIDRVVVRKDIHHIKDFKPIHLSGFEKTEMGEQWVEYMSDRYGADFREKIKNGKLLPVTQKMDPPVRQALINFMGDDVRQYKSKLETYRVLYKNERGLDDAKVKVNVQPYYVFG